MLLSQYKIKIPSHQNYSKWRKHKKTKLHINDFHLYKKNHLYQLTLRVIVFRQIFRIAWNLQMNQTPIEPYRHFVPIPSINLLADSLMESFIFPRRSEVPVDLQGPRDDLDLQEVVGFSSGVAVDKQDRSVAVGAERETDVEEISAGVLDLVVDSALLSIKGCTSHTLKAKTKSI